MGQLQPIQTSIHRSARPAPLGRLVPNLATLALLVLTVTAAWPGARAVAQDDDPGQPYRALIHQALNEFRLRNWPEARVLFKRAHALSPSARTLRGMGMVSYEMREYPDCVRELRASLSDSRRPLTESQRAEVQQLLTRALSFVATYGIELEPADAQLRVDGKPPELDEDGSLMLNLGPHTLRAEAPGHLPRTRELQVEGGESGTIRLALDPEPVAPVQARVAESPTATPQRPAPAVKAETAPPYREDGLRWTWLGAGATAAFGAATAAVWYTGQNKLDDRVESCGNTGSDCNANTRDLGVHEKLTTAGWALTAAALAATVVAAVVEWPRERTVEVALGPAGLSMRGRF